MTREDVLAVDGADVFQEAACVGIGVGIDGCGGDVVRAALCGRRERDGIDEVPSPVVLDLDCVATDVQENLAGWDGRPCCCRR